MSIFTDLTSGAVGGFLGGIGQFAKDMREAITGDLPPEKAAEYQLKLADLEQQAMSAQVQINLEEAKSEKLFVSGWRPFIGWVGGAGLAYSAILEPLLRFTSKVYFGYTGTFPVIDTTLTSQIVIAMLGIGVMRSYDKKQAPNVAGKE